MSPVSSFDQLKSSGTIRTLSESGPDAGYLRPVNYREVPEKLFSDRTRPVGADRTLAPRVRSLYCSASGQYQMTAVDQMN